MVNNLSGRFLCRIIHMRQSNGRRQQAHNVERLFPIVFPIAIQLDYGFGVMGWK